GHGGADRPRVDPRIDERPQGHVARDATEAVEITDPHIRLRATTSTSIGQRPPHWTPFYPSPGLPQDKNGPGLCAARRRTGARGGLATAKKLAQNDDSGKLRTRSRTSPRGEMACNG